MDQKKKSPSLSSLFSGSARDAAADVLVNFGAIAIEPLLKVLDDKDINVRYSAVRALGKLKANQAAAKIIELYSKETDPRFRGSIVVALAQIGGAQVTPPIIDSYQTEKDERVRCLIVTALGLLGGEKSLPALKNALADPNARVRANAVEAVYRLKGESASDLVRKLIKDPNNRVRANACKVLYKTDSDLVKGSLTQMIKSPDELERASAAYAMGEIGDPGLLSILVTQLKIEKAARPREHICEALGKLGECALEPLKEILVMENNLNILFALQEINRKKRARSKE